MSSNDNQSKGIIVYLIYLYVLSTQVMTLYFWWDYAQEHSFMKSLFWGFVVAECKGWLWPFFI